MGLVPSSFSEIVFWAASGGGVGGRLVCEQGELEWVGTGMLVFQLGLIGLGSE